MELLLAKQKMENEEGLNHLLVKVTPPKKDEKVDKPIAFILVLDVSVSMNGSVERTSYQRIPPLFAKNGSLIDGRREIQSTKLDFVKQASEKMVDMLKEGDQLGIVSFSDIAHIEYPLSVISKETRFEMKDRIQKLRVKGSTNVSEGLELAYAQLPSELKETHHIKLILLSDGEANYGITDADGIATLSRSFEKKGVSVSTIGVGFDYNSYFMETIATASGGMFYHLSEMKLLNEIFGDEIDKMSGLTMKNVNVSIQLEEGIHLEENLNAYEQEGGRFYIGNLYNEVKLVFQLATLEAVQKESCRLTVKLTYENEQNERCVKEKDIVIQLVDEEDIPVNKEVTEYVKRLMEAKAQKEALRHHENRDGFNFAKSLNDGVTSLRKMSMSYQMDVSDGLAKLDSLQENVKNNKMDGSLLKNMYQTSYSVMRNENDDKKTE